MNAVIAQPFGLGDIIFVQSIVQKLQSDGLTITFPVVGQYLPQVSSAYPDVNFVLDTKYAKHLQVREMGSYIGSDLVIPLRWSDSIMGVPYRNVMRAKYDMVGMDFRDWGVMFNRDYAKERSLIDLIGFREGDVLVQEECGGGRIHIGVGGYRMKAISGYSLFDWAGVFELAGSIHSVSTSSLYIFKLLGLMHKVALYPRPNEANLANIADIL